MIKANRWFKLVWIVPAVLVLLLAVALIAQWLRQIPAMKSFMTDFPGESRLPEGAPVGFPAWLGWQHFLNTLLMLLLIRSGWMVRTNQRPGAYWTRNNKGAIRTKNPPAKISLDLWFHLTLGACSISCSSPPDSGSAWSPPAGTCSPTPRPPRSSMRR